MPYGREADIAGVFRESVDAGAFGTIGDVILEQDARPGRAAGPDCRRRPRPGGRRRTPMAACGHSRLSGGRAGPW